MSQPADTVAVAVVPDFTGFGAKLESGVSASLRGLGTSVQAAFGTVEREVSQVGTTIANDFSHASTSAQGSLRAISAEANSAFGNVERQADQAANGISGRLGGALATIKTGLLTLGVGLVAGLGTITAFGLKSAATLEQTQISFNSLLGSVDAGTKAFKELQQFAAVTPFEFPEVAGAAQRFFAFSGSVGIAKDQVTGFLTTLGNVASVTGGGAQALNSVTLAMGQIASAGKVTLDNLNQISEALPGFSGVAAIASATGKTTAQVMDEISSGSLDATTGIAALLKGMATFPGAAGAMEAQGKTLLGVFSTFKDTLSQALVAGFAPVIPQIKDSLTAVTPILGEAIGQLAPALGGLVGSVLPLVGNLVKAIVPIVTPIVAALGPALAALGPALIPLGDALAQIVIPLVPIIPLVAQFAVVLIQLLVPVLQLLALVLTPLTPLLTLAAEAVAEFGKWLKSIDWNAVGDAIGGAFVDAWHAVVDFFEGIGDWFSKLPGTIGAALSALPGILVAAAGHAFDLFFQAVGFGIGLIVGAFLALPGILGNLVTNLWNDLLKRTQDGIAFIIAGIEAFPTIVWGILVGLWDRAKAIFAEGIDAVVTFVKGIGPRIIAWVEGLPAQFGAIGGRIIDGLIAGIEARVGAAVASVKRAMGDILDGAKGALGIHSPSLAFNTEVGQQIPPGIGEGVQAAMPDLHKQLAAATAGLTGPAAAGIGTAGGGPTAPISIVVNVAGTMTSGDAYRLGQSIGTGVADRLGQRGIRTTGRTV